MKHLAVKPVQSKTGAAPGVDRSPGLDLSALRFPRCQVGFGVDHVREIFREAGRRGLDVKDLIHVAALDLISPAAPDLHDHAKQLVDGRSARGTP